MIVFKLTRIFSKIEDAVFQLLTSLDASSCDVSGSGELDLDEFSETRGVVVPQGLGVAKRLQDRIRC